MTHHIIDDEIQKFLPINRARNCMYTFISIQRKGSNQTVSFSSHKIGTDCYTHLKDKMPIVSVYYAIVLACFVNKDQL